MIITNFDEIKRGHEHFLAGNERLLGQAEDMAGRFALSYVQQHSEFKRRTGQLQDRTAYRLVKTAGGRILRIVNPMPYAKAIDTGSKAHEIVAKNGGVLAFMGRAGVMVFRRRVWHPGTRPYKFLHNAADAAYRVLGHELRRGMEDLAKRF